MLDRSPIRDWHINKKFIEYADTNPAGGRRNSNVYFDRDNDLHDVRLYIFLYTLIR